MPVPVPESVSWATLRRTHVQFLLKGPILHCRGTIVHGPFEFVTLPKLESPDTTAHSGFGSPSVVPSDKTSSDVGKGATSPFLSVTDFQGVRSGLMVSQRAYMKNYLQSSKARFASGTARR